MNAEVRTQKVENDLRKRTFDYARRICRLFSAPPKNTLAQTLGKQLLRSGTSVGANHREASRARSKGEFIACLGICLRELDETLYWLELLESEKIFPGSRLEDLQGETNELIAIFVTILKRSRGD
jgi:four helix bundle protein